MALEGIPWLFDGDGILQRILVRCRMQLGEVFWKIDQILKEHFHLARVYTQTPNEF